MVAMTGGSGAPIDRERRVVPMRNGHVIENPLPFLRLSGDSLLHIVR